MSIDGGPGLKVEAPACVPSRYGLLSAAEVEDRVDGHWMLGLHTELESCEDLEIRALNCPPPDDPKETESGLSFPESDPFTLIAPFKCSAGGTPIGEAWDHAQNRMDQGESRSLERAFWTGLDATGAIIDGGLGQNPDVVDLTPAAGAVSITDGFALLESWAGENMPCAPILHTARGIAVYLAERDLIEPSGNIMYSKGTGSRVVVGGGYLVNGPMGNVPAAGEGWLYVTGSVKVIRGETSFFPNRDDNAGAVDRLINDVTVYAERSYAFTSSCGVAAVRVSLRSCCC